MTNDYSDLIDWLQGSSRTFGWGGLLAWDRNKVNSLLLQTYIGRTDGNSYLPTFTDLIVTSTRTAEYIHGFTLDCPRLSFENATVRDPRAHLRMQVVDGLQLSLEHVSGVSSRVTQIAAVDALDGRSLYMKLALMQNPGVADSAGQVVLDLKEGGDFVLTFAPTEEERWLGGEYFRKQFELLDDDQKLFVLGELGVPDGTFLKPADFVISTHGKPGDPERGAVLFFIRMEGEDNGTLPPTDGDLRFLLEGDYSCALLLGRDYVMRRLFTPACERFVDIGWPPFAAVVEDQPPGETHYLRAADGGMRSFNFSQGSTFFREVRIERIMLPLKNAECSFDLGFTGQVIELHWRGVHQQDAYLLIHSGASTTVKCRAEFEFKRSLRVDVESSTGRVSFPQVSSGTLNICDLRLTSDGNIPNAMMKFKNEISHILKSEFIKQVDAAFARLRAELGVIALDQMTGLLFHRREDLGFVKAEFPRDLVVFGHMQPWSDSFHVQPLERVMGPSETQQFSTWPTRLPKWSVENLAGQSGPVGRISAFGVYTAPTFEELPAAYLRVKVTATFDGYSSSALVTVVASEITVNPQVMVHTAGDPNGREMRAGTRSEGELGWGVLGNPGGRIVPSSVPGGDKTYFPGPRNPDLVFSIDKVQVTNMDTMQTQTAYVLLLHQDLVLTVTATRASDDTLQLRAFLQGDEKPELDREWQVLLGGGSVDRQTGVFTPGASAHRFAIVTVKLFVAGDFGFEGFILLPLPYIEIPPWDPDPEQVAALRGPAEN